MTQLTADDILNDIEFEILQGVLSNDELGIAIRSVRQFQATFRAETFNKLKLTDSNRQLLGKQFQVIDMLLTLLQETSLKLQAIQLEIQKLRELPEGVLPPMAGEFSQRLAGQAASSRIQEIDAYGSDLEFRSPDEIEDVMHPESIDVGLQTRQFNIPLIGWLLTKLRIFYQRPALFYTKLLITRQAPVNRVLGDRILYLEGLIREQQKQIQALRAQIPANHPDAQEQQAP